MTKTLSNKRGLGAVLSIALALSALFGAMPASAATVHPTYVVGTNSTSNDLKLNVNASLNGVSFSYLVGGVPAATFSNGVRSTTGMGVYVLKVASAVSETIFVRGSDPGTPSAYIAQDTGITNSQVTNAGPNSNFGAVLNVRTAFGSSYNGLAVVCIPLAYNPTGSSATDIWHCSESFTWPAFDNTGYKNALASTTWEQNSVFGAIGTTNSSAISIPFAVSNGATWFNVGLSGISASLIVDSEWDLNNASVASASSAANGLTYRDVSGSPVVTITAATRMYLIDQTSGTRTSRLDFYFGGNRTGDTSITLEFPAGSLTKTSAEPSISLNSPMDSATTLGSAVYYRFGWQLMGGGGGGGGSATPPCEVNGSAATLAQIGVNRTAIAAGESYLTTLGGQPISVVCQIALNSGFWVRTSVNSTVVTISGTVFTSNVRFSTITPTSYTTLLAGLVNQGYSTAIQTGDIWKREYFTTTAQPTSGDTPVATMTMVLGVSGGEITPSQSIASPSVYAGPQIMAISTPRPILSGGKLVFTGQSLDSVTQATIGAKTATLSFDAKTGLSIGTPAGLAPGKYDLVMESSFGKLTFINGVSIKAPTPTATIGFRSDAPHLNEKQVLDLVAFNQTLNPDYEKVRCVVNASDPKTAKRIADLVCAQVARGEARNVEVIKDIRNTYSGEGFWVRVYAAG